MGQKQQTLGRREPASTVRVKKMAIRVTEKEYRYFKRLAKKSGLKFSRLVVEALHAWEEAHFG